MSDVQQVTESAQQIVESVPLWPTLGYAFLCVIAGISLIIADVFVVSLGILSAIGAIAMLTGTWLAFEVGITAGLLFFVFSSTLGIILWNWSIRQLGKTKLVLHGTIDDDAGYRNHTESLGISVGSVGTMETRAMPVGRCQFAGGCCDVQVMSGFADPGQAVEVRNIDGPSVYVHPIDDAAT